MIDIKEEQKYEQLRKLGQELHIPTLEAFLELEVRDKDGKVIQKHKQRSHSWVRNAYNLMLCQTTAKGLSDATFGAGKLSLKQQNGNIYGGGGILPNYSNHDVDNPSSGYGGLGYMGADFKGICVGSGTNAESFEDYTLQTLIANGNGAGQLSYTQENVHVATYDAGTKKLTITKIRYFNNNSGGDIGVNELCIYLRLNYVAASVMLCRDKLPVTVTVPNTGQLKVTYTVQLTYPA